MPQTVAEIFDAVLALSEADREELLSRIEELLPPPPSTLHPDWSAELKRRADDYANGKVKAVPWEEVQAQAQAILDEEIEKHV